MINLISTKNLFILDQLKLEEALLRLNMGNWCIINIGSKEAIVAGASSDLSPFLKNGKFPLIRRFSGGGVVVIDRDTIFVTFIFSKKFSSLSYPEEIFRWSEKFYKGVFEIKNFKLQENDYVIGDLKCGGNAQYIKKDNWLHHTSFLWDYDKDHMNLLPLPKIRPKYRKDRGHQKFLTKLKRHFKDKKSLEERIKNSLKREFFIRDISYKDALLFTKKRHIKTTGLI